MARKRKRKPTLSQCLVGVATTGMPQPVRTVLGSRPGALLTMIARSGQLAVRPLRDVAGEQFDLRS
jgi:hypothetical protein